MRVILLAGGKGSRLWPLSTEARPKQFCKIFSCRTLLEETYDRVRALGDVTVVAPKKYLHHARKILGHGASYIQEQEARGTSFAIASALEHFNPDEHLIFFPCDHYIGDTAPLVQAIHEAAPYVEQGKIVTFGIKPTAPETRFGYIEMREDRTISQFLEKPELAMAKDLIQQPNIFWNAGIFYAKPRTLQQEWEAFSPIKSPSFDKAIMEKTSHGIVIPVTLHWDDIGTWRSLGRIISLRAKPSL